MALRQTFLASRAFAPRFSDVSGGVLVVWRDWLTPPPKRIDLQAWSGVTPAELLQGHGDAWFVYFSILAVAVAVVVAVAPLFLARGEGNGFSGEGDCIVLENFHHAV